MYARLDDFITSALKVGPKRVAVAAAANTLVLRSIKLAQEEGLVEAVLIGPEPDIRECAAEAEMDLDSVRVVGTETTNESAQVAVDLVRGGEADILMKGHLHTNEFLHAVLRAEVGLRTDRLLSHVFVMQIPTYHKLLLITDAAINIAPDLMQKADILQNAIDMLVQIGIDQPKAAVLSAIETINPKIPSTVDAACLHKMAERGQIKHALVDGPMAFDNAISSEAAREKGIRSPVAGDVDIVLAPGLDAGNILYKNLVYLSQAQIAGIVMGARAPVVLTSRADTARARVHSLALASLICGPGMACYTEATA
jgi:phosphate butyryltransferase